MTLGCIPCIPNALEVPIHGLFILWGFFPPSVAAKLKGEETMTVTRGWREGLIRMEDEHKW